MCDIGDKLIANVTKQHLPSCKFHLIKECNCNKYVLELENRAAKWSLSYHSEGHMSIERMLIGGVVS